MVLLILVVVVVFVLIVVLANRGGDSRPDTKATGNVPHHRRSHGRRVSLVSKSIEPARDAWLSGDLQRMINALESKAKLADRHFLLMAIVKETYGLRADPEMADKCVEIAELHIGEFPKIKTALTREFDGRLPQVSTFQHYATLLTERREFDRAVKVCERAISLGLQDGTKGGYEGRIARIRKTAAQKESASTSGPNSNAPAAKSVASRTNTVATTAAFSELHRRRKRRIKPRVLELDNVPFISLPRSPQRWEERDASAALKEDEGATEFFELLGKPGWDLSAPAKVPKEDRPDPAYRLHFSSRAGTFLVDDLGRAEAHPGAPAAAISFGASGAQLVDRQLDWDLYRREVNPLGRGLIGISSNSVLHCYDEQLNTLAAFPLSDAPELRAAKSRLGIDDRELHRHIRTAALRPDGGAYLFSVVDEAFAVAMDGRPLWGVRMPQQEGWERVGVMSSRVGSSADVERAMATLNLTYPFGAQDVKHQYRELAKRWHPDKNPGRETEVAPKFRKVVDAAELLSGLDMSEFAAPRERAFYRKTVGQVQEIHLEEAGVTMSIEMSLSGDERSTADWIYAAGFGADGGAFLAGYSGKIVEIDQAGQPQRLFDTSSVPRRIADTGDYLYFLTDTRLYVIQGTSLSRVVDVFGKGELVVGETGFGLLDRKAFRWYTEVGEFVGGVRTKHPLRRIYPTKTGWNVETRQHRAELRGVPSWLDT